jgi:hypothetical protein
MAIRRYRVRGATSARALPALASESADRLLTSSSAESRCVAFLGPRVRPLDLVGERMDAPFVEPRALRSSMRPIATFGDEHDRDLWSGRLESARGLRGYRRRIRGVEDENMRAEPLDELAHAAELVGRLDEQPAARKHEAGEVQEARVSGSDEDPHRADVSAHAQLELRRQRLKTHEPIRELVTKASAKRSVDTNLSTRTDYSTPLDAREGVRRT